MVEAAAMDAFIACWDTKMTYDFARPYTLVHYLFKDKKIKGWAGPDKGWGEIKDRIGGRIHPKHFYVLHFQVMFPDIVR